MLKVVSAILICKTHSFLETQWVTSHIYATFCSEDELI